MMSSRPAKHTRLPPERDVPPLRPEHLDPPLLSMPAGWCAPPPFPPPGHDDDSDQSVEGYE